MSRLKSFKVGGRGYPILPKLRVTYYFLFLRIAEGGGRLVLVPHSSKWVASLRL